MKNLVSKFKNNLAENRASEQGDIVQTLLIIVIFVVIVVAVGGLLWNAIQGQASRVQDCINGANPVTPGGGNTAGNCAQPPR